MRKLLPQSLALMFAFGLTGLVVACAVHTLRPFDVAPPVREKLIEQPMVKPAVPAGWKWIDRADGFSVYAPPGTIFHHVDGIDWLAGEFEAPDFSFRYYLGFAPQPLHGNDDPPFAEEAVVVDGRHGIIQRYVFPSDKVKDGRRWYSRLLLRFAVSHYDYSGNWDALDLYGRATSLKGQADMERMWRSIRFDAREVKNLQPPPRR